MDNITHTLIGIGTYRLLPKRLRRPEAFWASAVANNIPDSDFLQRFLPNQDDLSYIVHHRGYTHSLLFAIPLGLLVGAVANRVFGKSARSPLGLFMGLGGAVLHILADFMNDYGVHPFTPFFNRWYYADSVFILEPFLWFSLIPVAILTVERKFAKAVWSLILAGVIALIWSVHWISAPFAIYLTVMGALLVFITLFKKRAEIGLVLAGLSLALFFSSGAVARKSAVNAWENAHLSDERVLDVVSTPLPGNPFCWKIWIRTENEKFLISRLGFFNLLPDLITSCKIPELSPQKAELSPVLLPPSERMQWVTQSDLSKDLHAELIERSCRYRKFLNFSRLPYVKPLSEDGEADGFLVGDLRYDRGKEEGFADFKVTLADECAGEVDVWERPTDRR